MRNLLLVAILTSCAGAQSGPPEREVPEPSVGQVVDVLATSLQFNVAQKTAFAIIDFARLGPEVNSITLEKGSLVITAVADASGPLRWTVRNNLIDVGIPAGTGQIRVDYKYAPIPSFNSSRGGALAGGSTRTWPNHCGNLFPCNSDPSDGAKYRLALTGLSADQVGVFPTAIRTDAPSFMPAFAVGAYAYKDLGKTKAGTTVGAYFTDGGAMGRGTRNLVSAFSWFEENVGPYPFGDRVASVEVDWKPNAKTGAESHPYWHVSKESFSNSIAHIHEAAHGWFGNGVRIQCWEDLVLAEGVVSYLTARALAARSRYQASKLWREFEANKRAGVMWPKGCNQTPVQDFFTGALYARGALLFRDIERGIGQSTLDEALASFFAARVGKAARFADLLAHIKAKSEVDVTACAESWLRSETRATPRCTFQSQEAK